MRLLNFLLLHAIFSYSSSLFPTLSCVTLGNETDRLALLAFKSQITQYPSNVLSSWNDSQHFCDWEGVNCSRRHHQRVQTIRLVSKNLFGQISPHIGNLSFLRELSLQNNSFHGIIPGEISRLFRLRYLQLYNNSFVGEILNNISSCSNIIALDVSYNSLVGNMPMELGYLPKSKWLSLRSNNFSGVIPASFGNLTFLKYLDMSYNSLSGSMPSSLNQMKSLTVLDIAFNNLSGLIPSSLYNISTLEAISLSLNNLEGELPYNIGLLLPHLQEIYLGANTFSGPIPPSLYNASKLQWIEITQNQFTGEIHPIIGNLNGLRYLSLGQNLFGSGKSGDLDFVMSLTNCSNLNFFGIEDNQFGGMLPNSIASLSTQLTYLLLDKNLISGEIPNTIGNLHNLIALTLDNNHLTGSIPMSIGKLRNLQVLDLSKNQLSGLIPSSVKNCSHLYRLHLSENNLGGTISSCLDNQNLQHFYAASNRFTGSIPPEIGLCSGLLYFEVGNNLFTGSIPSEVGNLRNILKLDLSENKLSGEIPSALGSCLGLLQLDLSLNNLSGEIPKVLGKISELQSLNLSSNNLEGEVPLEGIFQNASAISISKNKMICGGISELELPKCRGLKSTRENNGIAWKVALGVVIPSFIAVLILVICWRKKHAPKSSLEDLPGGLRRISYIDLHNATNGFSSTNLVGVGSYGSVYKGILHQDESHVAVKVLNLLERGAFKSFIVECEALKAIRHRNLLKIITVCSSVDFNGSDFKALVFEFMPNGSLESWLHPVSGELNTITSLDLSQRLNIAIDVASALDYLHNQCGTPIIHCDLKPSNILLNDDFTACVGDFGLAKYYSLVTSTNESQQNATNSSAIRGTVGYIPPEYGTGGKISPLGDVYSYGILLLEIFTGKRPTDHIFEDGLSLHEFSKRAVAEEVMEVIDTRILSEVSINEETTISFNQTKDFLTSIMKIGIKCSLEQMSERMSLRDVLSELNSIKEVLLRL